MSIKLLSFRIIDPPQVPETSNDPNRGLFFTVVFFASLLAGVAVAFLISQIRPAFYSQNNLREVTKVPVLGTVPMIWTDQQKTKRKRRLYAFGFSLLMLTMFYFVLLLYIEEIMKVSL